MISYKILIFRQWIGGTTLLNLIFADFVCIFSKNKATLDKVFNRFGYKCSKELKKAQFYFSRDHGCEL